MANLTINNTTTVTSITGARLNVIAIVGKQGAQGIPGIDGTGASVVGISSLNGLTGAVTLLTSGNNLDIRPVGNDIYIDISGVVTSGSLSQNLSGYVPTSRLVNTFPLTGDVTITASQIPVGIVPGTGYSNLQQFINTMHSPGLINGATISVGGLNTIAVSRGTGMLRVADDNVSSLLFVDIPSTGIYVPPDTTQYFVGFVYNSGNPYFETRATFDWNHDTEVALGSVINFSGLLLITNNPFIVGDPITNIIQRFDAMAPISRDASVGGLLLGEKPDRYITLSAGKLWTRLNDYDITARDTSISDFIYSINYNGSSWQYGVGLTRWANDSYNDITVGLVPLTIDYYANLWFYLGVEDASLGFVYGQAQYGSLSLASEESPPGFLPIHFTDTNILVARLTFGKNVSSANLISSAFSTVFTPATITDHDNLSNLQGGTVGEYYHLTAAQHNNLQDNQTGVKFLNGLTGTVNIAGTQGISISTSGQSIYVSGQDWATNSSLTATGATLGQQDRLISGIFTTGLFQTGSTLDNKVNSLSGFIGNVSGGLQAQVTANAGTQVKVTGSSTLSSAVFTGIGGLLVFLSGSTVFISGGTAGGITQGQLDALSGWAASNTNLALTGSNLYNLVVNASGQANSNFATLVNVTSTGAQLVTSISSLSGYLGNVSGGLQAQIATKASIATTDLISGNLIQTGIQLVNRTNLISGILTTGLTNTGASLYNLITALSGQANVNYATIVNLTATGATLFQRDLDISGALAALISSNAAGVSNLNGLSGSIFISSAGTNVFISASGQTLYISGSGIAQASSLALTGSNLYNLVIGMSGQTVIDYATKTNLTSTGAQLGTSINSLSGFVGNVSGGLQAQIGTAASITTVNLISGNLIQTGVQLRNSIDSLSGFVGNVSGGLQSQIGAVSINLTNSGITLINRDILISGILTTGLTNTGVALYSIIVGMSGQNSADYATKTNLLTTGQTLYNLITGSSGQAVIDYATKSSLLSTGQQAWSAANNNGINLSGNLIQTGVQIVNSLNSLSGFVGNVSGGLQSQIATRATIVTTDLISGNLASTGQQLFNLITGASGQANTNFATKTSLTSTGATLFQRDLDISGALAALISSNAAGVSNLNGLSGSIFIASAGTNITITPSGQTIYISGTNIASATNLAATGSYLYNLITGASGISAPVNLSGYITTGQADLRYYPLTGNPSGYVTGSYYTTDQIDNLFLYINPYFFDGGMSNVSGYRTMVSNYPSGNNTYTGTITSAVDGQYITGFITNSGFPGLNGFIRGTNTASVHAYKGGVNQKAVIPYYKLYAYDSNTSLSRLINTSTLGAGLELTATQQHLYYTSYITGFNITPSDRLIINWYANVIPGGGTAPDVSLVWGDATDAAESLPITNQLLATTYYSIMNPSGFIGTGITGQFYASSNPQQYVTSGNLTNTGILLINRDFLISGILTTGLTNTGVLLVATDIALSGFIGNVSGGLQSQINTKASITTTDLISGNLILTGQQAIVVANNNAINLSGNLTATGIALINRENSIGSAISGNLTSTGVQLVATDLAISGFIGNVSGGLQSQINSKTSITTVNLISGNLISTGQILGTSLTATGVLLVATDIAVSGFVGNVSGGLQSQIGTRATIVTTDIISGNLIQTGVQLGSSISSLSGFVGNVSGGLQAQINTKASITTTDLISGNLIQTGIQLRNNDLLISGILATGLAQTGSTLDNKINSLSGFTLNVSGALQTQIGAANGTQVQVTGSSTLTNANLTGLGSIVVTTSGSIVYISGSASVGGGVTQAQLDLLSGYTNTGLTNTGISLYNLITGASGWLLYQPQVNLNGGTGLLVNTIYYDNFNANRTLTITGAALFDSSFVTLYLNVTGVTTTVSFPTGYRLGDGLITGLTFTSGINVLNFTRSNGQWIINDSAAYLNNVNFGRNPTSIDSIVSGYAVGSQWINAANNLIFECVDSTSGAAIWASISAETLISGILTTGLTNTGVALINYARVISGVLSTGLTNTGVLLGSSINSLSGFLGNVSGGLQSQIATRATIVTTDLISGNLIQTGVQLVATDIALSGFVGNVSGGLQAQIGAGGAQIKVTGSSNLSLADFSGIGGTLVILSGNKVLISGGASGPGGGSAVKVTGSSDLAIANFSGSGATTVSYNGTLVTISSVAGTGAGVNSINSMNNAVTLIGTGGLVVTSAAGVIAVSGFTAVKSANILFNNSGIITGNDNFEWHDDLGTLEIGEPTILYPYNPLNIHGSGAYLQIALRNTSNLSDASSDLALTTDVGSDLSGYLDLGINNSNYFNPAYSMERGGDGYLYVNGGHLDIATQTTGKNIQFFTNSTSSGSLRMTIHDTGISIPTGHAIVIGDPIFLPNNPLAIAGSGNTYVQVSLQNRSSGFSAQADFILTADVGTDTDKFVDLGINNSNFADTGYQLYKPLDGFLYNRGGDMFLGTATTGKNVTIHAGGIASGDSVATFSKTGIFLPTGKALQIGSTILRTDRIANYQNFAVLQSGLERSQMILGPSFWNRHITAVLPATTTSQIVFGNTIATAVGTVSTLSTEILGQHSNIVSAATTWASAGQSVTTAYYFRGTVTGKNGFFFSSTFAISDGHDVTGAYTLSGARIFIGMTDQTTSATVLTNDPAGNRIGLAFCWATGGTQATKFERNWFITSKNNVTEFTGVSAMNFQTGFYRFSMYAPPFTLGNTGVMWEIEDLLRGSGTEGIATNNLPIGSTALRPSSYIIAGSGGARNLKTCNLYVENTSYK